MKSVILEVAFMFWTSAFCETVFFVPAQLCPVTHGCKDKSTVTERGGSGFSCPQGEETDLVTVSPLVQGFAVMGGAGIGDSKNHAFLSTPKGGPLGGCMGHIHTHLLYHPEFSASENRCKDQRGPHVCWDHCEAGLITGLPNPSHLPPA